jgi:hypothetical protein
MKYILLLLTIALTSCSKNNSGIVTVYNAYDFHDKVRIEDTACINQTKRAKRDIAAGRYHYNKNYYDVRLDPDAMRFLTREDYVNLGITVDTTDCYYSDIITNIDKLFHKECYYTIMNITIEERYKSVIDSLAYIRGTAYVKSHPDELFAQNIRDFKDYGKATDASAKVARQISYNELEFKKALIYPAGYMPKNEKNSSYTTADFILLKDGTVKDLKVKSSFGNYDNQKFKEYFENAMKSYVLKATWVSPLYFGLKVNCEMHFTFFHK